MAETFDRCLEFFLLTLAPIMFLAAGIFLWLVHDEVKLAVTCGAMAVIVAIYGHFHLKGKL